MKAPDREENARTSLRQIFSTGCALAATLVLAAPALAADLPEACMSHVAGLYVANLLFAVGSRSAYVDKFTIYVPQRSAAVWTGASQRCFISSSSSDTVTEQPAMSSEVTKLPTSDRAMVQPDASSRLRTASYIR